MCTRRSSACRSEPSRVALGWIVNGIGVSFAVGSRSALSLSLPIVTGCPWTSASSVTSTCARPISRPVSAIAPVIVRVASRASGMPSLAGKSTNAAWSRSPPVPTMALKISPQPSPPSVPDVTLRCGLSFEVPQPSRRREKVVEPAGSLARLGLTGYEARAYLALTRRGVATGAELARLAGLPRQRIYDVLEALVARGFATIRAGRPLRYSAVAPAEALERLLEDRRLDPADREQ